MSKLTVKKVGDALGYQWKTRDKAALSKTIKNPDFLIPGLEMTGFLAYKKGDEILVFGVKEIAYLQQQSPEIQHQIVTSLIQEKTPLVVIGDHQAILPILLETAAKYSIAVIACPLPLKTIASRLNELLENHFAPQELFHGTLLEIYGQGVIIVGKSGIGKSEVALELIKKGHRLVADDAILLNRIGNEIHGRAPVHLKNYLEVRGIGLIDVYKMFGVNSVADYKTIRYIIELANLEENQEIARLEEHTKYKRILESDIPCATILVGGGRNIADLVEVAVTNLRLKAKGIDTVQELVKRHNRLLKGGKIDD